jgi:hypothetical protein
MTTLRLTYPLPVLCRVLAVSRSGYYAWCTRQPSQREREDARLEAEIRAAHTRSRGTFGPERLQRDLASYGITTGICDHPWHEVLLVLLDEEFELIEMHAASRSAIETALKAPGSKARKERGALGVSKFKTISKCIWSRESK